MYSKDGTDYFVVDAHIALWDARPENQRNIHGKQFIDCFYDYTATSPRSPRSGPTTSTSTRAASG